MSLTVTQTRTAQLQYLGACSKPNCKVKLFVDEGGDYHGQCTYYVTDAGGLPKEAGRGPQHSLRHRCVYHDYWCQFVNLA